jgi:protein SCO1
VLHPRVRLVLIVATVCALAAVAGVWIAESRDRAAAQQVAVGAGGAFEGALRPPGAMAPPLDALRDQEGRPAQMPDELSVVTFVYSTCEDTCPTIVASIRGALDRLGDDVPVLAVSVDPDNDTPHRARRFVLEQHMTGRMRFLLGSQEALEPVWRGYGIAPQRDGREHSAYVVVVDARGRQRIGFPVGALTPEGLAHDLRALGGRPS